MGQFAGGFFLESYFALNCSSSVVVSIRSNSGKDGELLLLLLLFLRELISIIASERKKERKND